MSSSTTKKQLPSSKIQNNNNNDNYPSTYNNEIIMKEIISDIKRNENQMENEEPDMNNIKLLEKISAKEVLLRDRVRRKLLILKKRPNTRNKLIRIANRSGRTSKLKPSELLDIIKRNGITLSEIESDWLILYLDPNRLNQLYVEDLLSLLEISGSAEYDSHYSNNLLPTWRPFQRTQTPEMQPRRQGNVMTSLRRLPVFWFTAWVCSWQAAVSS